MPHLAHGSMSSFTKALGEIKQFAQALDEMGGSILSTVDGVEVTVEHVAAIEQKEMLQADYGSALEKFRRVSKLKKELDRRPPIRKSLLAPSAGRGIPASGGAAAAAKPARAAAAKLPAAPQAFQPPAITAQQISVEEGKLRRVEESIRVFVRVADPKYRQIVPMRFFNLTLTAPEADAYNAGFLEEKSLRADVARTLIRPGFLRSPGEYGARRTQTQPEHVLVVETSRRCACGVARHREHGHGRGRRSG